MRLVKKYANRKLYDTVDKRYITMDTLGKLVKTGDEVKIIDNDTGTDLTVKILTQLLANEKPGNEISSPMLMRMLRKGPTTLFEYGKKYVSFWQNALLLSREELDKFVNNLVRDKELSESEGKILKNELVGYSAGMKRWIKENIDTRVKEAISMMNLASIDHVAKLSKKVDELDKRLDKLEKETARSKRNVGET
jgi:polyhydroxyalkanoate synthesis repressor PhaR